MKPHGGIRAEKYTLELAYQKIEKSIFFTKECKFLKKFSGQFFNKGRLFLGPNKYFHHKSLYSS